MSIILSSKIKPFYSLTKLWTPINFQGGNRKKQYFEGWYFKNVSENSDHIWSVIPGISIVNNHNKHAFIQFIDGKTAETFYVEYPLSVFSYSQKEFSVSIAKNHFSLQGISLDIDDEKTGFRAKGKVIFSNLHPLGSTLFNPGIMGWYSFVPFMECNHGLVSMHHELSGNLLINNQEINFDGGRGYSEKDWGRSMPSAWIWMQSNHFDKAKTSCMLSVAKIPWLKSSFTGFLCVVLLDGKIHRYATYTGAKLTKITLNENLASIEIRDKNHIIKIKAKHAARGLLAAPENGAMDRRIAESVDAIIHLIITDHSGREIFSETGNTAGLELVGDMKELPI